MFLITTIGKVAGGTQVTDNLTTRLQWLLEEGGQIIRDQANEIERLRGLCEHLRGALEIQQEFHRRPIATTSWYANNANEAMDYYIRKGGWQND